MSIKKILIALGILGVASAAGLSINKPTELKEVSMLELKQVQAWQEPKNDKAWAEDVKVESFNVKHDYQLDQMEQDLTDKLPKVQKDLDKFTNCPECIKWDLKQQFSQENFDLEGKTTNQWIESEYQSQLEYYQWKTGKIEQSLKRLAKEKDLRTTGKVDRLSEIIGTTYYVSGDAATDTDNGLSTSTPYRYLDQFTEVARTAGDVVIVRRGTTATINNGTDLTFLSDGTIVAPIVIEADYDNVWGDFISSAGTATLTFGSTTVTMSTTTGLAAGQWFYNPSDSSREYAYEILATTTTGFTTYLPFKGTAGTGITLTIMPANPQWNIATGDFQWNFDTDENWKVQGLDIRGTDANGNVEIDSSRGHQFINCIFQGDSNTSYGIKGTDDYTIFIVSKSRFFNNDYSLSVGELNDTYGNVFVYDSYFDGNAGGAYGIATTGGNFNVFIYDTSFTGYTIGAMSAPAISGTFVKMRNNQFGSIITPLPSITSFGDFFSEDFKSNIGLNEHSSALSSILSTSTTVRSGGGATSLELRPTTNMGTQWDFSKVQLFEYPIYADTTSKTYSVYFRSSVTADWTNDPLATEFWIECEYWGHATNNYRRLTKSTGTLDFNGTTTWNALSVTCQPSQNGILYLRSFYAKQKEAGTNIFFMDVQPQIQ